MKKTKKIGFAASVIMLSLVLPLINILVFRGFGMFFQSEPLKFPDGRLAAVFLFVYEFLVVVLTFFPPICIAYARLAKRSAAVAVLISVFSVPFVYIGMMIENVLINSQAVAYLDLVQAGLGWVSVAVCYALVLLAVLFVEARSKKAPRESELFSVRGLYSRGTVTAAAVTVLYSVAQRAVETYIAVKQLGAPENFSEVLELATPYVITVVGGFVAYIVGCALVTRWEDLYTRRGHRK